MDAAQCTFWRRPNRTSLAYDSTSVSIRLLSSNIHKLQDQLTGPYNDKIKCLIHSVDLFGGGAITANIFTCEPARIMIETAFGL